MKKKPTKDNALQFNVRYADLAAAVKLVREDLKKNVSFVKKLAKKADKLYVWADKNCYADNEHGIEPIIGIRNLNTKMDILEWLSDADISLKSLTESFNLDV